MPMNKINSFGILLCFLLISFGSSTLAQKTICGNLADTVSQGQLTIHQSARVDSIIQATIQKNKEDEKFEGYRIQIYFGKEREKAKDIKTRFYKEFPGKSAYLVYEQPNFKVRVGNFRAKMEAQRLFYDLKEAFETVLIVPTKIEYPELD